MPNSNLIYWCIFKVFVNYCDFNHLFTKNKTKPSKRITFFKTLRAYRVKFTHYSSVFYKNVPVMIWGDWFSNQSQPSCIFPTFEMLTLTLSSFLQFKVSRGGNSPICGGQECRTCRGLNPGSPIGSQTTLPLSHTGAGHKTKFSIPINTFGWLRHAIVCRCLLSRPACNCYILW